MKNFEELNIEKQRIIKEMKKLKLRRWLYTFFNMFSPNFKDAASIIQLISYIGSIGGAISLIIGNPIMESYLSCWVLVGVSSFGAVITTLAAYNSYPKEDEIIKFEQELIELEQTLTYSNELEKDKTNYQEVKLESSKYEHLNTSKEVKPTLDDLKTLKEELIKSEVPENINVKTMKK